MYTLPGNAKLLIEDRKNYLYAEVSGPDDSFEISMAYWTAIAEQCHQRDSRRLLVLERLGDYAGERDMTLMIDSIIALGFENIRVAFVDIFIEHLAIAEQGHRHRRMRSRVGDRRVRAQRARSRALVAPWLTKVLHA